MRFVVSHVHCERSGCIFSVEIVQRPFLGFQRVPLHRFRLMCPVPVLRPSAAACHAANAFHLRRFDDLDGLLHIDLCASEETRTDHEVHRLFHLGLTLLYGGSTAAFTALSAPRLQRVVIPDDSKRCPPFRAFPFPIAPQPSLIGVPFTLLNVCLSATHHTAGVQRLRSHSQPQGIEPLGNPLPTHLMSP